MGSFGRMLARRERLIQRRFSTSTSNAPNPAVQATCFCHKTLTRPTKQCILALSAQLPLRSPMHCDRFPNTWQPAETIALKASGAEQDTVSTAGIEFKVASTQKLYDAAIVGTGTLSGRASFRGGVCARG
eukprot:167058-Rhodomonas_salina.2